MDAFFPVDAVLRLPHLEEDADDPVIYKFIKVINQERFK
jgi:hypothetical protein